eukprot:m.1637763 g.1637763  ORF g.1637763 m.1637763 type:complete len:695 (-) comp26195_c0_seq1:2595-4679(-)
MGNASSVKEVDYTRNKKGKSKPENTKSAVPKIKQLDAKKLTSLYSYLEVQTEKLGRRVEWLNKQNEWENDYNTIKDGDGSPCKASLDPNNAHLNRYRNIVAYDHSRVEVEPDQYNMKNPYINANWIPGYKQERGYIASQGPIPDSMASFWQMVWKSGSTCIVMVTNEIEGNKMKCHRYWPARENPVETYGAMTVTLVEEIVRTSFIHRTLELKCSQGRTKIDHFQYIAWPDHGVPNSTNEIMAFRKEVRRLHPHPGPPITVHCSAGVGRSGTFIIVDTIMNRAEHMEEDLDIRQAIRKIRQARNYMVQTVVQYQFCFKTILDGLEKAMVRTVRVVQHKSDEVQNLQYDIEELQGDISEAYAGYNDVGTEEPYGEQLEAMQQQVQGSRKPDVRWSAFNREEDLRVNQHVPGSMRIDALASQQDAWRSRDNVPIDTQEKGYDGKHQANLLARVDSLAINSDPDAWKTRYAEVAGKWQSEAYDLTTQLNPMESRMMSLANQQQNWKLRGEAYRRQIQEDTKAIVADLNARIGSLSETIARSDERWKTKGDGMRGVKVAELKEHTVTYGGTFEDRLHTLINWVDPEATKKRGTVEGRVVESPQKIAQAEREAREAEEKARRLEMEVLEAQQREKEKAERAKREEEARRKAESPVKAAQYSIEAKPAKQLVKLKSPEKKQAAAHPMLADADEFVMPKKR